MLAGFTNERAVELADKLINLTKKQFCRVYYSDNGSCAMEIAIKMAIQYYENIDRKNKKEIIHFSLSYHGDTVGVMSIAGNSNFNRIHKSLLFESKEFISPDCYNCPVNKKKETCNEECVNALTDYVKENHSTISAIVTEPLIHGASGMKMYKKEVLEKISKLCKECDILFILDEVFTGLGRTGKDFAYNHGNIYPDIIALAKGLSGGVLPLAATIVTEKVYEGFYFEESDKIFYHGHTMTGNPPACAAACASIELYQSESRLQDVLAIEIQLRKYLNELIISIPEKIKSPRTLGAVTAFEIQGLDSESKIAKKIAKRCIENGVLIRPLGDTIYLTPPYNISNVSLKKVFDVLHDSLQYYNDELD
jgi:adenosylmethionine-8-amino-7-oxononanoate aminotransferase